ncbi:hypothetical protein NQ314_016659, partial [Rhamnusium bicolor]
IIIESWKRRKLVGKKRNQFIPTVDRIAQYIEENPNTINNEDFMNHLMTLFTAAFDTLTIVSSFAILCFGMYPEYQLSNYFSLKLLDKWIIPKEAAIAISIFNIHRDKSYWEHPEHFYPDHFLPEAIIKRHIYAYLPFSAGPRGCIGTHI